MSCEIERNLVLAELEALGSVSLCACGTLHLSVGAVTLRLAPEAFGQMLRMCQNAADQMLVQSLQAHSMSSRTH
jgi:hypothetical protein